MKNIFVALCLMALCAVSVSAQERTVKPIEGDIYFGLNACRDGYQGYEYCMGFGIGGEVRYNLDELPADVGGMLDLSVALRCDNTGYSCGSSNETITIGAVGDWNFFQGRKFNPYVGLGLGLGYRHNDAGYGGVGAVLKPRVGIEILHHFRLSFSAHITQKSYNNLQLTFGITFGGSPIKE